MLKVKRETLPLTESTPTTAQHIDAAAAAGRPITLRIDDRPPLVVKDEHASRLLWQPVDRIETLGAVQLASKQMAHDVGVPFDEAMEPLRKRFGIPNG